VRTSSGLVAPWDSSSTAFWRLGKPSAYLPNLSCLLSISALPCRYVDNLPPGGVMPYAWDEPTQRNQIRVQVGRRFGRMSRQQLLWEIAGNMSRKQLPWGIAARSLLT
jgi:hypothetical protein